MEAVATGWSLGAPRSSIREGLLADLYIAELSLRDEFQLPMTFQAGDIQILNSRVTFHARKAFDDHAQPERKRLLLRVWLNARNPRPMAPEFANQLNTGERGAVTLRQ